MYDTTEPSSLNVLRSVPLQPNQMLPMIDIRVFNTITKCCVDSGASAVYIKRSFLENIIRSGHRVHISSSPPVEITLGDNSTTTCQTSVKLMLNIDGTEYPTKALMINEAPYDVILGMSFLRRFSANLSFSENRLRLRTTRRP